MKQFLELKEKLEEGFLNKSFSFEDFTSAYRNLARHLDITCFKCPWCLDDEDFYLWFAKVDKDTLIKVGNNDFMEFYTRGLHSQIKAFLYERADLNEIIEDLLKHPLYSHFFNGYSVEHLIEEHNGMRLVKYINYNIDGISEKEESFTRQYGVYSKNNEYRTFNTYKEALGFFLLLLTI